MSTLGYIVLNLAFLMPFASIITWDLGPRLTANDSYTFIEIPCKVPNSKACSHFNSARATRYESPPTPLLRLQISRLTHCGGWFSLAHFPSRSSHYHCMMETSQHFELSLGPRIPVNEVSHDAYLWGLIDQINLGAS